ncbi:MAG: hypothetical protein K2P30_11195, partial [Lachnospiraceae bacterium]|nr:hypothetical protein [Lachnospiraceae bacterium]
ASLQGGDWGRQRLISQKLITQRKRKGLRNMRAREKRNRAYCVFWIITPNPWTKYWRVCGGRG